MTRDINERFVLNPGDVERLRSHIDANYGLPTRNVDAILDTVFGVPFTTSPVVPPGQILRVRLPIEPVLVPTRFDEDPVTFYARQRFGLNVLANPNYIVTLCEGAAPIRRLTKAQRRRRVKRFIREEIARRRMERRLR